MNVLSKDKVTSYTRLHMHFVPSSLPCPSNPRLWIGFSPLSGSLFGARAAVHAGQAEFAERAAAVQGF